MIMEYQQINRQNPLVLASESPRRKGLLKQLGLPFRVMPSRVDEEQTSGGAEAATLTLAANKAKAVQKAAADKWILGADTMVVLGESILGKPGGRDDAFSMLSLLSGKEHRVITGFCILNPPGRIVHRECVSTIVRMKPLNEREIAAYISTEEPFGKAGGYAIQGIGAALVESISGSYTNVVGLPLCALIKALIDVGAVTGFPLSP